MPGASTADRPSVAAVSTIQTQIGDLAILSSDSLFDNLQHDEILKCAYQPPIENIASLKKLAWLIGRTAQKKFDVIDDITIVVTSGQVI